MKSPRILAIDTSTKFLCIGIYADCKVREYNLEVGSKLSSLLAGTIKRVMDAADLEFSDIDYFACGLGPGSFTGMRVGLAFMKGLSWSLNKPIIGISSLDILAQNASGLGKEIVPCIDARRGLIYYSVFKAGSGEGLKRIKPYMLLGEKDFLKGLRPCSVFLGDALDLFRESIQCNISGAVLLDKDYWRPKGCNIIELALRKIKDKKTGNAFKIKPIYLYPKECQIRK